MDLKKLPIKCKFHSKESLKKVDPTFGSLLDVLCPECIIADETYLNNKNLVTIEEFINKAIKYYEDNFNRKQSEIEVPEEIVDLISKQKDYIEQLQEHVKTEQETVQKKFDEISIMIFKIIADKRDELFRELENQVVYARNNLLYFEKLVKKAYPKLEDADILFPKREDVLGTVSKFLTPVQIEQYIKNLKEDMNEGKLYDLEDGDNSVTDDMRRKLLKEKSERIEAYLNSNPTLLVPDCDLNEIKKSLDTALNQAFDKVFNINSQVEQVGSSTVPKSLIIKASEFQMIRGWFDKEYSSKKLTLLFRGTRDGMNATTFHSMCNNKGPTLSIMKSKQGKIFGGYVPESWTSKNSYINTKLTWLFSVTAKKKYEMNDPNTYSQYGAYDYYSYGPTFGGGHDIYLSSDFTSSSNYCNRHSYNFPDNTTLTGGYNFQLEEIEVYKIG